MKEKVIKTVHGIYRFYLSQSWLEMSCILVVYFNDRGKRAVKFTANEVHVCHKNHHL